MTLPECNSGKIPEVPFVKRLKDFFSSSRISKKIPPVSFIPASGTCLGHKDCDAPTPPAWTPQPQGQAMMPDENKIQHQKSLHVAHPAPRSVVQVVACAQAYSSKYKPENSQRLLKKSLIPTPVAATSASADMTPGSCLPFSTAFTLRRLYFAVFAIAVCDTLPAALALRTPQTLDAAGGINVDGTWVTGGSAAAVNTARFADKSLLVVDATGVGSDVALSGEAVGTSTLTVGSGAKLHIVGGQDGKTVNVTGGFGLSTKDAASWTGSNLTTSTALLSATGGTFDTANGEYSVTLKANAAASSFPLLSSSMGVLVDSMVVQTGVNPDSSNAGVRFISRAVSDNYIGTTDHSHAAATIEGAAQMAAVGAVQGSTLSAATAASGAVTTRTSMALPRPDMSQAVAVRQDSDGSLSLDSGLNAGDGLKNGLGVWIMPLYQSNNVWGMKAENFKSGYNSNLGGIALGTDYTFNDMFRLGAAFNIGAGYAKSSGDFNSTHNNFNFWGVSLYGGWVYDNFGLSADVGYTGNYSKVEQDMPASMQMRDLKADVTSHAWNTGLKAEYKFNAGALDIIPHVGVRYLGLVTDGYDVKSGGTVFEVDGNTQSIWTFPVGMTFAKAIETESGWQFKPQLDLGVIPAAGDVKAKSKARVPGVDSQAEMKMQVVDYATFDGGLGFELGKGDFTLGLNYNLQASEHRTGHGVFGTLRYEF